MQCERSEARKALAKLRCLEPNSPLVNREIEEIEENLNHVAAIGTASPKEIFMTKSLRTPLLICIGIYLIPEQKICFSKIKFYLNCICIKLFLVIHIGQQLNGINCVIFYAESIFSQAGMTDANLSSILLGVTQLKCRTLSNG